ncbi:MAG: YaiI/YqxD family protein [Acidobacteriota bacterium]
MKILVDADACPKMVLQICFKLAAKYGVEVWTVASFNHNIESNHHVVVGNDPQEADIKLINLCSAGDITVTQDWGLAAMLLGKGAFCISPDGRQYQNDKIDFLLEEREVKAKMRRAGGRTKGPAKRSTEADERFAKTLERILSGSP